METVSTSYHKAVRKKTKDCNIQGTPPSANQRKLKDQILAQRAVVTRFAF